MPCAHAPKRQRYTLDQELQDAAFQADDEEESSSSDSPFDVYFLSDISSSSSSSSSPIDPQTDEIASDEELNTSQVSQDNSSSCSSLSSLNDDSSFKTHEEENPSSCQNQPDNESLLINEKAAELIKFLLLKYKTKEPITKAEIMTNIIKQYEDYFLLIFQNACECLELVFGLSVKEEDHTGNSYIFYNVLDLTYEKIPENEEDMPKTGLLMLILNLIFMEGNCVSEKKVWQVLSRTGIYPGREHAIYGEPKQFLTGELVQEKYVEYRQVPNTDPPCYEFVWGPRAHAETSKMKVLKFLAKVNNTIPSAFSKWYEDAMRDEEERAKARIAPTDSATAEATSSFSATTSSSPGPSED
ncbi:PREDICTED: melanoma-associated antigen 10-like [Chrysochloris asiatica]|uniref:Melanoma-associated antigen 10-like n=1 Tax=Chrysochloris asiatica TaxID=185453 RepID=A0A9B0TW32_CHRAS|nr:PREDICTED: melanoma-associated antigen 10-like [Chrysochloris asiatica]